MAIRRCFIGLAIASIFVIGIWLVGSVPQVMAETLNFRTFSHVTKREALPLPDAEGHSVGLTIFEGVWIFENGELAWGRSINLWDMTKEAGTIEDYATVTFQDGSTITHRTQEATPAGVPLRATKRTGEIIHGTGRFQGIKGTITTSSKRFPPEKGELAGKSLAEGTITYTLPSK
jgi:hypothetical protein